MKDQRLTHGSISLGTKKDFRAKAIRIFVMMSVLLFVFSTFAYAQWVSVDPPSLSNDWS